LETARLQLLLGIRLLLLLCLVNLRLRKSIGHGQQSPGRNEVRDDAGLRRKD